MSSLSLFGLISHFVAVVLLATPVTACAPGSVIAQPLPGASFKDCPSCPEMIALSPGKAIIGAGEDDRWAKSFEQPRVEVSIRAFALARYELTWEEWGACVADGACRDVGGQPKLRLPITNVSWDDVREYAAWLSKSTGHQYRLPSEAEWEYAARAGTTSPFYWGDDASKACAYENVSDVSVLKAHPFLHPSSCTDGYTELAPVGRFLQNGWGFHDIAGNASELTEDAWTDSLANKARDGSPFLASSSIKVARGGNWFAQIGTNTTAYRARVSAREPGELVGVRIARALD